MRNLLNTLRRTILILGWLVLLLVPSTAGAIDGEIPIEIDDAAGPGPDTWPVTTGVPFPRGALASADQIRLVDGAGAEIPIQKEVTATWDPAGTEVKWLLLDFQASALETYRLQYGAGVSNSLVEGIVTSEDAASIFVDAGEIMLVIPKQPQGSLFTLFRDENADGEHDPSEEFAVLRDSTIEDNRGIRYAASADATDYTATVEVLGPLRTAVRLGGWYVAADGTRFCKHITRIEAFFNKPYIRIYHTFIFTGDTDDMIADISLVMERTGSGEEAIGVFPRGYDAPRSTEQVLLNHKQSGLLIQEKSRHAGQPDTAPHNAFGIYLDKGGKPKKLFPGKKSALGKTPGWATHLNDTGGATVGVRHFWQTFPKEIEATRDGITVHLWSSRLGQLFRLNYQTLLDWWGDGDKKKKKKNANLPKVYSDFVPGGHGTPDLSAFPYTAPLYNSPSGFSRTHEIWFLFHDASTAPSSIAGFTRRIETPLIAAPDIQWTCASGVYGDIHPYDPVQFPEMEGFIGLWMDRALYTIDTWGYYGFYTFGANPAMQWEIRDGALVPTRRTGTDYGFHLYLWLQYARSHDRRYREMAETINRFIMDARIVHAGSVVDLTTGGFREGALVDWSHHLLMQANAWSTPPNSQHTRLQSLMEYYYQTGYRRALEVFLEVGDNILRRDAVSRAQGIETYRIFTSNGTSDHRGVFLNWELWQYLYRATWDPRYSALEVSTMGEPSLSELLLVPGNSSGVNNLDLINSVNKGSSQLGSEDATYIHLNYKFHGILEKYLFGEDPEERDLAEQSLLKLVDYLFTLQPNDGPLNGNDQNYGQEYVTAYAITGDRKYLNAAWQEWVVLRNQLEANEPTAQSGRIGFDFFTFFANHYATRDLPYVMASLAASPAPPDPFPVLYKAAVAERGDFFVEHVQGSDTTLEVSHPSPSLDPSLEIIGPGGAPHPELASWEVVGLQDGNPFVQFRDYLLRSKTTIPAGYPSGSYRFILKRNDTARLLTTSAARMVLYAPRGLMVGAPAAPLEWFFQTDPDAPTIEARIRFYATTPKTRLVFRDSTGQPVHEVSWICCTWIRDVSVPVAPGERGRLWRVSATDPFMVDLRTAPPFFAYARPERFFLPQVLVPAGDRLPANDLASMFVSGKYGSGAVQLNNKRWLSLPLGASGGAPGVFDHLDLTKGTVEFWYQPRRPQAELVVNPSLFTLSGERGPAVSLIAANYKGGLFQAHYTGSGGARANTYFSSVLEIGRWYHVALQWDRLDQKLGIFVDGELQQTDLMVQGDPKRKNLFVGPPTVYGVERILVGRPLFNSGTFYGIDGAIDEFRISDVIRYPFADGPFTPPALPFAPDTNTRALFHFDGDTAGVRGIDGAAIVFDTISGNMKPPEPPGRIKAKSGVNSATVRWEAPASDGGSPVTGYVVVASPGGASASAGPADGSVVVEGLAGGTRYSFTVVAINAAGRSASSRPTKETKVKSARKP